jgi:hypothetical protein
MGREWARDPRDASSWPRLFTVGEANDLLPEIVPLIMEMRARKVALDAALAALDQLLPAMRLNGHAAEARDLEARIHELTAELASGIDHLGSQGVEVKSLDHGLIDFPSWKSGRVVYLCWRLGEGPLIRFWHEIDAGFAGRRTINDENEAG